MHQNTAARHLSRQKQNLPIKSRFVIASILLGLCGGYAGMISAPPGPTAANGAVLAQEDAGDLPAGLDELDAPEDIQAPQGVPAQEPEADKEHDVVITEPIGYGSVYGSIEIPGLGDGWTRPIYEGTGDDVLAFQDERGRTVASKYVNTQPFGSTGITGITGHSGGLYDLDLGEMLTNSPDTESLNWSPFTRIEELQSGDDLFINTEAGTYSYKLLWIEKTTPDDNDVLYDQVYRSQDKLPGEEVASALVLTTCGVLDNWNGDMSIRRIAYFELVGFAPKP